MTDLNKLEMEWRRYAIAFRDCGSLDAAALCERHADELEAALAGGGEAAAQLTTYEYTNSFSARMHDVVHDLPPGTYNLYLRPAALADRGEPFAWCELDGDEWVYYQGDSSTGQHILKYQKDRHNVSVFPLYRHPAGAVQVTDEMVDRYMARARPFCNCDVGECVHTERDVVRAALTAALNPGGSRDHD